MKKWLLPVIAGIAVLAAGGSRVEAAISFGSGYYTNLCDSGTAANNYTCDPGCNPATGTCTSAQGGAVKYSCNGKLMQCMEAESAWGNAQTVGNPGCGKTVQLSLFNRKCRQNDGTWDDACVLKGYMVWYSGDCDPSLPKFTASPSATLKPTASHTVSPTGLPAATPKPTATPIPTATPRPTQTPQITLAATPTAETATAAAVAGTTPETGASVWWGAIGLAAMGGLGWKMRQIGKKLWD
jgi:hypothetical protein